MQLKPIQFLFVLSLGVLGVVVCGVGIAAVWSIGSRLTRTNEKVFNRIDESLAAVRERVLGAQRHVQDSKITCDSIEQSLRNWTGKKTSERLESRLEVQEKAQQLTQALQQVDRWLELSGTSIQSVQQAMELGSSIGAPVDATSFDPLLEQLDLLRTQLKQATETVDGVRERAADVASLEERMDQAVQLALRVVVTFSEIDDRLGSFADRLSETQAAGQDLESRTYRYIVTVQIVAVLLIVWMAAGQVCMCMHGWKLHRQQRTLAAS